MHHTTVAWVIGVSYGTLFALWTITRRGAIRAFSHQPLLAAEKASAAGLAHHDSVARTIGALWVFLANIGTAGLFMGSAFSPALAAGLPRLRLRLPRIVNLAGAVLFVIDATWCTLALIYNPGYRPFFLKPKGAARLATGGPYALVRHPRYVGEAALNVILAAFTGAWLPLLGVLGWPALGTQAQLEEKWLLTAAPEAYREYCARVGRFLPRLGGSSRNSRACSCPEDTLILDK